jgi:hypothetical protein
MPEFGQVAICTLPRETRTKGAFSLTKHKGKTLQARGAFGKFLAPDLMRPDKHCLMSSSGKIFPSTENIVAFRDEFSLKKIQSDSQGGKVLLGDTIERELQTEVHIPTRGTENPTETVTEIAPHSKRTCEQHEK